MDSRNEMNNQPGIIVKAKNELVEIMKDKRVFTLIKLIADETPLGKVTKPLRQGYRALIQIENEQRRNRLKDFIVGIAQDNPEIPDIPPEDFLAVVRKLLQDDEDEKVYLYVHLCVTLARSHLDRDTRLYYLRMASELTFSQIKFARELYLRSNIPLKGYLSIEAAKEALISAENGMTLRALSTLSNWGLIKARNVVSDTTVYDLTEDMQQLMNLLFSPPELMPEAIGSEAKDSWDVIIVNHLRSANEQFPAFLHQLIEKKGFSVEVVERESNFREMKLARCYITTGLYTERLSYGEKKYVAIHTLQHPDNPTDNLKLPDRRFKVPEDSFFSKGLGQNSDSNLLIKKLDEIATYIVAHFLSKTPN